MKKSCVMGKALILSLMLVGLSVTSINASAEWTKVFERGNYVFYVDKSTITKEGSFAKMWYLNDFHISDVTAESKEYSSIKMQDEYDCKQELRRTIYLSNHSGNMGGGDTIIVVPSSQLDRKWSPVEPKSLAKVMWDIACVQH